MTPSAKAARFDALAALGCVCCRMNLVRGRKATGERVEIHHLNGGGHHGQKRRGDEYTIPLCTWHHRGLGQAAWATMEYGPSWAKGSKPFRREYGSDDELLAMANALIGEPA